MIQIVRPVATHIISGFLGAGKTTLLKALLQQKPPHETWAVLMNEFGEIGIDQTWIQQQGIAVKEVLGGCLCCTSQLPMQIALARLLSEYRPTRLWIEPTGLGHPKTLLQQLTEPHWQRSLQLRQVITVLDGQRLHQQLWQQHEIFLQQLDIAEIVLISHQQEMTDADERQLQALQQAYAFPPKTWIKTDYGQVDLALLDKPHQIMDMQKKPLLSQISQQSLSSDSEVAEPKTLPYHYQRQAQGFWVAGWCFPKDWQFDGDTLVAQLQTIAHIERLKAKFHTVQGWLDINAVPQQYSVDVQAAAGLDSRIEIISRQPLDVLSIEQLLLSHCYTDKKA